MKKIFIAIFVSIIVIGGLVFIYQQENREAKILFVGDMMFDRYIRQVGYNKGEDFIFSCLGDFLKNVDLVVGNLEGPITENPSKSMFTTPGGEGNYTFTFPTNTAKLLAKNNIKLVNLGNNHIGNFGKAGVESTKKYLDEAGVDYIDSDYVYRTKIGSAEISFISYNEFALPAEASAKAGGDSVEKIAKKIKEEKENKQTVIVYAHWGDEYVAPPQRVKNVAKKFADSGADFIIGSHPHVILGHESFDYAQDKKTVVYYSLGNFIFDQYFSKEVSTGLILELNIKNKKIKTIEHKVSIGRDGRTCLVN
ncbi:MAG: CapA family protein [Patescibacteria group bacterium]